MEFTMRGSHDSLCQSCVHGLVTKDDRERERVFCGAMHTMPVFVPIKQCTRYAKNGALDEYDLMRVAWVLEVKKGQPVGFRPPKSRGDNNNE